MSPMYPDMYDFNDFGDIAVDDSGVVGVIVGIYLIMLMLSMAYSVLVYVLQSLGMYSIAKRRGIHHAWMSWFPIVSAWILGSISDQYQYVAKGRVRNRRKVLLGLEIAMYALLVPVYVIAVVVGVAVGMDGSAADMGLGLAVALLIAALAMLVIAIVAMVFLYICYYDLFASCNPDNAVAFLILSIFFTFLLPYFVFACRKKDLGMPPRKPRIPENTWQPAPPPPAWQPPVQQQTAWQAPPAPPAWQQPQQNAWQPPVNTWQAPEQPAPAETEPEAPKTEEE